MIRKVKTNYSDLTQGEFEKKTDLINTGMTNNSNFPTPPNALTDIMTKKEDWKKELNKSQLGDHAATANAKVIQNELIVLIKENGDYVNNTAKGNVGMLETSGYTLIKERVYGPKPDVEFKQGQVYGECIVVIEAIPEAITYLCEIAPDPCPSPDSKDWDRQKMSSKATIVIKGLEPRKLYWFRFCYLTVEGEMSYCEPVSFSIK